MTTDQDTEDDFPPAYGPTSPVDAPPSDDIPFPPPEPTPVDPSTLPEKPEPELEWPSTVKLAIEVESETIAFLAVMSDEAGEPIERATSTLQEFFDCVHMGIKSRGSWERGWLVRAFGDSWTDRLEVDPSDPHHMRIKVPPPVPPPVE